ncbi:MAG: twin-arginine translocase subunit TatC [Burkholderiales bacterium]|nr:twin-arginine translocase subunit TatC [Burkholderiales bacterium]
MSDNEQGSETFLSHLVELRDRLLRAIIALLVAFLCLVPWSKEIYGWLALPMLAQLPAGVAMIATEVTSPFFIPIKVTLLTAVVLALPVILYQVWAFVAPGLYAHEKRLVAPLVVSSSILFMLGMAFAYFIVFPVVFGVMKAFTPEGVAWMPDIGAYFNFVVGMFIAFGVTFEVPVAVILAVKAGMISIAKLREIRPYVIVGSFVIAAIVTPPDVLSQLLLAIPLCLLYEAGILVAAVLVRNQTQPESEYQ